MAKQIHIKHDYKKGHSIMRKTNNIILLIFGILLFFASYAFDHQANLFFKSLKLPLLEFLLSIITNFGVVIVVMLFIPLLALHKKEKRLSHFLFLAFISSIILAFIIKLIVLRQRPIEAFTYPFTNIVDYSFPSMHSMAVFASLPFLTRHLKKQKYFWIAFAFLVAFSRVYLGFHFLSDVVFGAFFGYFIGESILKLYGKNHGRHK